jgi:hypothetical protein
MNKLLTILKPSTILSFIGALIAAIDKFAEAEEKKSADLSNEAHQLLDQAEAADVEASDARALAENLRRALFAPR